jgi:thiol-disulfide isomerase/thioredoxin
MYFRRISLCLVVVVAGCGGPAAPPATVQRNAEPPAVAEKAPENHVEAEESDVTAEVKPAVKMTEEVTPAVVESAKEPASEPEEVAEEKPKTTREYFGEAQRLMEQGDMVGVVTTLEKAIPGDPENINLLFTLADLLSKQALDDTTDGKFATFQKAAGYVRKGIQVQPEVAENPRVRELASKLIYNEACALAHEEKAAEALNSLNEAIGLGFSDLVLIDSDADLANVRALEGYAEFKAQATEALRLQAEANRLKTLAEIDQLFAENQPFDFDFQLQDTDDKPIAFADFKGKVLIVDIWGTWCPPCKMEIPHFVALQKKFEEAGLAIVGLNQEQSPEPEQANKLINEFREQQQMNYRCALLNESVMDQVPQFSGFPTTMFFDRTGKVRVKVVGYHDYEKLELIVQKLLDEKAEEKAAAPAAEPAPAN